jgi:monoamine oxidase
VGGQWIKTKPSSYGMAQDRITALAKELGVPTFKTYYEGNNVGYQNGLRTTYPPEPTQELPPGPGLVDILPAIVQLDEMAKEVGSAKPWAAANAAEYEGQTFQTWGYENVKTEDGRKLIDLGAEAILACQPRDVSLLYVLFYIAASGTLENLFATTGGYQESRFVGGAQQVSQKMARALGKRVIRSSPVNKITQRRGRVVVESRRAVVTAKRVVVTVPQGIAQLIRYEPGLPAQRAQLLQRFPMGSVIKVHAVYDRPFWRDDGLTGFTISDQGPIRLSFDNTPPSGSPGMLVSFFEGDEARHYSRRPPAERRAAVLGSFARYFGDKARNAIDYIELDWMKEPWSRGCYGGIMPPGTMLSYGAALRPPTGLIHWAGTETAALAAGYMDGAVRSGERAAREVLARL